MIFLSETSSTELVPWLLEQTPITIILSVVIYWLVKRLQKVENERDEIYRETIKLATLWERKTEQSEDQDDELKKQILESLKEIKDTLDTINRKK